MSNFASSLWGRFRKPFGLKALEDNQDVDLGNHDVSPSDLYNSRGTGAQQPPFGRPAPSPCASLLSSPGSSSLDSIAESSDDDFYATGEDEEWPGEANDPVCPHASSLVTKLGRPIPFAALVTLCLDRTYTRHDQYLKDGFLEDYLARTLNLET